MARHFASHGETSSPLFTIQILEYIKLSKDIPRSNSLGDEGELTWIFRLNSFMPIGLNIINWDEVSSTANGV